MCASDASRPLLWQLTLSHYSEKLRWALEHKRIDHRRRTATPGAHIAIALWLSRGAAVTFPLLELGADRIADSSAAIAALERRFPQRPLFPADPPERRCALELEEFFDEELGPPARLLPLHELRSDPKLFGEFAALAVPEPFAVAKPLLAAYARLYTGTRFGTADPAAAARARERIIAALDRLEAELARGDGDHLVGAGFTVADLTAASMFSILVLPPGGPLPPDLPQPPGFEAFRDELRDRPGYRWVEETYRRYRGAAESAPAAA